VPSSIVLARLSAQPTFSDGNATIVPSDDPSHSYSLNLMLTPRIVWFVSNESILSPCYYSFLVLSKVVGSIAVVEYAFTEVPSGSSLFDHDAHNASNK
jgi:hypothetical protein